MIDDRILVVIISVGTLGGEHFEGETVKEILGCRDEDRIKYLHKDCIQLQVTGTSLFAGVCALGLFPCVRRHLCSEPAWAALTQPCKMAARTKAAALWQPFPADAKVPAAAQAAYLYFRQKRGEDMALVRKVTFSRNF